MTTWLAWTLWPLAVVAVFLGSTVAFDVVHWLLHQMAESRSLWLRRLGGLHQTHHRFLDRDLRVHRELIGANIRPPRDPGVRDPGRIQRGPGDTSGLEEVGRALARVRRGLHAA